MASNKLFAGQQAGTNKIEPEVGRLYGGYTRLTFFEKLPVFVAFALFCLIYSPSKLSAQAGSGTLQQMHSLSNGTWGYQDLTASSGGMPAAAGSAVSAVAMNWGSGVDYERVFYLDANNHVQHMYSLSDGTWGHQDLTASSGGMPAAAGSAVSAVAMNWGSGVDYERVFYLDANNHVQHMYSLSDGTWGHQDLTASSGGMPAAAGSAVSAVAMNWGSGVDYERVFYLDANNHVQHMYSLSDGTWGHQDLTASSSGMPAAAGSAVSAVAMNWGSGVDYERVFYLDANNHVQHMYSLSDGTWGHQDLTTSSGGMPAAAGVSVIAMDWGAGVDYERVFSTPATIGNSNSGGGPTDGTPDTSPAIYPSYVGAPPAAGPGIPACADLTGSWSDSTGASWQMRQNGSAVYGALSVSQQGCTGNWNVIGQAISSGEFNMSASPVQGSCNQNSAVIQLRLSSCTTGTAFYTFTAPGGSSFSGGAAGQTSSSNGSWTRLSAPLSYSVSPSGRIPMSTGDTVQLTTRASFGDAPVNVSFQASLIANPNSFCSSNLQISNGSGTGSTSSAITASPAPCSGIFSVIGAVGATGTNYIQVIIPPQPLIQVLYGEAHGQASKYGDNDPTELAVGATIRNRLNQKGFANNQTFQGLITPNQFNGIAGQITNGPTPELQNAALLFTGEATTSAKQNAMNVGGAKCFFSPDAVDWQTLSTMVDDPRFRVVPKVNHDPRCFTYSDFANEQIVYKKSISSNTDNRGAPAFLFERYKDATAPAVVSIP